MDENQIKKRRLELLKEEEANGKLAWWWLSFATEEDGFRGVNVVQAKGFISAHLAATFLGINPGGQVRGMAIDPPDYAKSCFEKYVNKLLTKEECTQFDTEMTKLMEKFEKYGSIRGDEN